MLWPALATTAAAIAVAPNAADPKIWSRRTRRTRRSGHDLRNLANADAVQTRFTTSIARHAVNDGPSTR